MVVMKFFVLFLFFLVKDLSVKTSDSLCEVILQDSGSDVENDLAQEDLLQFVLILFLVEEPKDLHIVVERPEKLLDDLVETILSEKTGMSHEVVSKLETGGEC